MVKVIVFSDITIYCDGLSRILANTESIEVIAAENNLDGAVAKIKLDCPDVILLDMTMQDSCQIARKVMQLFPEAKIVGLAVPENEANIVECAEVGIAGYVAREASLDELIATVIGAKEGEFCCPPRIAAYLFHNFRDLACGACKNDLTHCAEGPNVLIQGLTPREQQMLNLMASGLSNKLISRDLNIEVSTVKNHVHNILVKLGVKSRAGAISLLYGACISDAGYKITDLHSLERTER